MKTAAIIAAAGIGRRMGGDCPKQYLQIGNRPIICHTLDRFHKVKSVDEVVIVVEPGREVSFIEDIIEGYGFPKSWKVTAGGKLRHESVANGLEIVSPDCDVVLVHDGVRPFISEEQIRLAVSVAACDGACAVAMPLKDTIKRTCAEGFVQETLDRERLWGAQTPQAFSYRILREAYASAIRDGFVGTDEASVVERAGVKVSLIRGSDYNIKITTPSDIVIAEAILKNWKAI